jgi:putative membrane-bound dehydrogenase-like protein
MKLCGFLALCVAAFHVGNAAPFSTNGNRLAYLDSDDPFYVGRDFPKLITPQWVGEEGVDAVIILSIDDMRETPKYEAMLRPILERLKKIDGRAPVSIMVNTISPTNAQLQSWLKEGVSLDVHTIQHPCPLCQRGDFNSAATNYHACVDLMSSIPGNKPVAFRMPCCDSMNSPSPRFYSEIFNRTSPQGNFLGIDSSVMVILTTNDTSLPRELVMDADGRERFRKYLPSETNATTRVSMGSFATTIEDYPYPYVIGKLCWEFPCIVPSDWEANNLHKPNNPKTVEDWERALDAIVLKQGVMTFIFHPHGWIQATQMVQFIDYAVTKYGKRVKFLNFKEAQERLNKNLLRERLLRDPYFPIPRTQLIDVDNDGKLDSVEFSDSSVHVKSGKPPSIRSTTLGPVTRRNGSRFDWKFGVFDTDGSVSCVLADPPVQTCWTFRRDRVDGVESDTRFFEGLPADFRFADGTRDLGVRFRDVDGDAVCEILIGRPEFTAIYKRGTNGWRKLDYPLPPGTSIVDAEGRDAGLRFVDVDGDGYDDVIFSNHERYSLHLFRPDDRKLRLKPGWSDEIVSGKRVNPLTDPIPPIVRDGTNRNNGVWFARETMWIQNEDTAHLPDKVDRRTFKQLLSGSQPRAMSPEESLKAMHVRPGFKVELVASEPLIQSPVAFEWSADGRLWVVEMGDYPNGIDGKGQPGGRVRILEDTDGDGRYDKATTFLEGLNFPNGIYPWRNGVVISAAPDIFYAEDANGDGKADVREVLFTGFTPGNQQHRANGFDYGLDGWLYGANGDSGGNVRAAGTMASLSPQRGEGWERRGALDSARSSNQTTPHPNPLPVEGRGNQNRASVDLRNRDFRIHPDHRSIEGIEGQTQFGRHRDDFGNWFGNNNPNWLWHYFFPDRYLARNPLLPLKTTKKMLANYNESARCFPISRTVSRFNDPFAANHVTSGNSATPYRDELFGKDFATSVFISEPVHNLVHREVLEPDGVTFTSHRASDEATNEFLASSDNWFRPTMLKTGPDGALYIADVYRLVIEHPEWIPKEMQARLDLRAGADKGRIYRVYPEGATLRKIPNLAALNTVDLVDASETPAIFDSPNGWQRDTVQRLLVERNVPLAVAMAGPILSSTNPKTKVQALWTLETLGGVPTSVLLEHLKSSEPLVQEAAVRLSERSLRSGQFEDTHVVMSGDSLARIAAIYRTPSKTLLANNQVDLSRMRVGQRLKVPGMSDRFIEALLQLTTSPNARVRYQLAFTLGEWDDSRAAEALVKLVSDTNENIRNAALSSAPLHAKAMLPLMEKLPANDRARAYLPMLQKLVANPPSFAKPISIIERTTAISAEQRAERAKVLARYADVPKLRGDSKNGAVLFKLHCTQCHRLRGEGVEIGPDLGMMAGKPAEQFVMAILDPNAAVETRYQNFSATMKDGHEVSGIIIAETPTTLTLRAPNRADETLLRGELKELSAGGLSLMPDGLESALTPQQLADLIAFVTGR